MKKLLALLAIAVMFCSCNGKNEERQETPIDTLANIKNEFSRIYTGCTLDSIIKIKENTYSKEGLKAYYNYYATLDEKVDYQEVYEFCQELRANQIDFYEKVDNYTFTEYDFYNVYFVNHGKKDTVKCVANTESGYVKYGLYDLQSNEILDTHADLVRDILKIIVRAKNLNLLSREQLYIESLVSR